MVRVRSTILAFLSAAALAAGLSGVASTGAAAYGNLAQWQIGLSFNCDNPTLCASSFGLGGFWGWIEFDTNNTGDAELTGCSHLQASGPALGANHFSANITSWSVRPGSTGPMTFFADSGFITVDGRTGGSPVTFPFANQDVGAPAIPGHFSSQTVFGFTAPPGTNFEIQVVQLQ